MRIAVGVAQPTQRVPEDVWRVAQHRFSALRVSVVPAGVANHTVFGAPFSCSAFFSGGFYMLFREFSWGVPVLSNIYLVYFPVRGVRAYIHALQINGRIRLEMSERGRANSGQHLHVLYYSIQYVFSRGIISG